MGLNKNRGLSTLIGDMDKVYNKELGLDKNQLYFIEISKIIPNPFQPRKNFEKDALNELANSIEKHGLIQPIIVLKKDDNFILVAGERRLRATQILGQKNILAFVSDKDESKLRELALIENIQRENLNPIELANSYKDLIEVYNITQENLADFIHKSRAQITNTLRLLNLDTKTQELIASGKISQGHAKVLVGLSKEDEKMLVENILIHKLSVRDTEKIVRRVKNKKESQNEELQSLMQDLRRILNKFGFVCKNKKNQLIISLDDIDKVKKMLEILN